MVLLKRFNTVGASTGGYIQVLASAPLGQRERAVLLQVGADQILVALPRATSLPCIMSPILLFRLRRKRLCPLKRCGILLAAGKELANDHC